MNSALQPPGSAVLFEGGRVVEPGSAGHLEPDPGASYSSYGTGRAVLRQGVWFCGEDGVVLEGLRIDRGPGWGGIGIASSTSCGNGVAGLVIRDSEIVNVSIAVHSTSPSDAGWSISGNHIKNTGDSALIIKGANVSITQNKILDAGFDPEIPYGKHAVYAAGPDMTITDNTIDHYRSNGLSMRYRGSVVERNTIRDGPIGIAWFQDDLEQGWARWRYNTIRNYSEAGIYISPSSGGGQTRECFEITNNAIDPQPLPLNLVGITPCSIVYLNG